MSPWASFIHIHRLLLALCEFGFNSKEMFEEDDAGHVADRAGPTPNLLIHRAVAFERGVDADDIKRRVARGDWQILRRGAYARSSAFAALPAPEQHRLRVAATMAQLDGRHVVSHRSAACLHGIALLHPPSTLVQVTNSETRSGHRRRTLQTFCAALDPDEITILDGTPVTTVARTIIDVARTGGFDEGVVAADHALHEGWVDRDQLAASAARAARRSGIRTAHQVIAFADAGAESVGESRSRIAMDRQGLPPPELQFRVVNLWGNVIARTDFRWREFNTVGEFDGATKYGRGLLDGRQPGDAVFQEKLREDSIRDHGLTVVRWTWDELDDPRALPDKIGRALTRGRALAVAGPT